MEKASWKTPHSTGNARRAVSVENDRGSPPGIFLIERHGRARAKLHFYGVQAEPIAFRLPARRHFATGEHLPALIVQMENGSRH